MNEEILLKYLQKECSEDELKNLSSWLAESDENRQELFRLEVLYNSGKLKRYSDEKFIQKEKLRFYEHAKKYKQERKQRLTIKRTLQYAAVAVLVLFISVGAYYFNTSYSMQTVAAGQDKVEQLVLPDGTKIWLNKSAVLKYPKKFKGKTRKVLLDGEAYFEVAKNAEQPFIVETELMEVTVLGTMFNLHSPKGANISYITLIEGEVQVKGNDNEGMVILSPGQRAEINRTSRKFYVKETTNASIDAIWHNGLIPFNKATIAEIAKALEEIYKVKVHVDPNVNGTTYSGTLKSQDSISKVLRSLKNSIPIKYEMREDEVYISNK